MGVSTTTGMNLPHRLRRFGRVHFQHGTSCHVGVYFIGSFGRTNTWDVYVYVYVGQHKPNNYLFSAGSIIRAVRYLRTKKGSTISGVLPLNQEELT